MKKETKKLLVVKPVVIVLLVMAIACGGKQTVASKSQRAYAEAKAKGIDPGGGAGGAHGGHSTGASSEGTVAGAMAAMDHSKMNMKGNQSMAGMDHSKMNMQGNQSMAGMDHSKMNMKRNQSMAGMDHSKMDMPGNQSMTGMDHSSMSGIQHGSGSIPRGGLWGPVNGTAAMGGQHADHVTASPLQQMTVTLGTAPAPTSSRDMSQLEPAMTLRQDAVDIAAPISVHESAKGSSATSHKGHADAPETGQQSGAPDPHAAHTAAPSKSASPSKAKAKQSAPAKKKQQSTYVCPMHPEVTSTKPGRCPKCGMDLVKKEKR